jgi:hypothetical protein
MKRIFFLLVLSLGLFSCEKQVIEPGVIEPPVVTTPNPQDSSYSLVGQTWIITRYRTGEMALPIDMVPVDTIKFITKSKYTYNSMDPQNYSFYSVGSVYSLTLNYTVFGYLTGTVNKVNLEMGVIIGGKFTDISIGVNNPPSYYLWMEKI